MNRNIILYSCYILIPFFFVGCGYPDIVERFNTSASYELAKAVYNSDLDEIEKLVDQDSQLMEVPSTSGINVLILSIYLEEFEVFKTLLELGSNPNYRNPINSYTPLIESIRPFGSSYEWREDYRYQNELLKYGADPNLKVDSSFTSVEGTWVTATSPAIKASKNSLESLKLLLEYGIDYKQRVETRSPFSEAISSRNFEIVNFYIDSLNIDVHQPMRTVIRKPSNERITYYIQDYINKYMSYEEESEGYRKKQILVKKLKSIGVDFDNYDYRL
jgi:ankyrin repeat protein